MFVDTRLGNRPRYWLNGPPKESLMLVPEEVRKSVVFLGFRENDTDEFAPRATGFLVGIPLCQSPSGSGKVTVYLVTAKHVADRLEGQEFGVRMNKAGGGSVVIWVEAEKSKWWRHPSEPDSVDAAVFHFGFHDGVDGRHIHSSMIASDDVIRDFNFGPGDEVFYTGLFVPMRSASNVPIVRTGNIAAMPDERLKIRICGKPVESRCYLIEARSLGGLSGSPVFVREPLAVALTREAGARKGESVHLVGSGPFFLLGLAQGHWEILPDQQNEYDFRSGKCEGSVALGIAIVVPARDILTIINQEGLAKEREVQAHLRCRVHD
jgi:hypothetical protein